MKTIKFKIIEVMKSTQSRTIFGFSKGDIITAEVHTTTKGEPNYISEKEIAKKVHEQKIAIYDERDGTVCIPTTGYSYYIWLSEVNNVNNVLSGTYELLSKLK